MSNQKENQMTKDNWLQLIAGLLVLFLILAIAAGQATANAIYEIAAAVLTMTLMFLLIGLGTERGTELLKIVLRFAFNKIPLLNKLPLQPNGAGSLLLALIVALASVFKFDLTILKEFPIFDAVDPQLVSLLTVALIWITSSGWHALLPDTVGKAQPVDAE